MSESVEISAGSHPLVATSRGRGRLREIMRDGRARVGTALVIPVLVVAIVGPFVTPLDPNDYTGVPFTNQGTVFGTDFLGRDVLSRFLAGGEKLLLMSFIATVIGVAVGALLGSFGAYIGGAVDTTIVRLADVVLAFPAVVLALMVLSLGGSQPWLIVAVVAVGIVPRTLRVLRGATMSVVSRDFVRYSDALGDKRLRVVYGEILPNVTGPLMVESGLRFTYAVGLVAMLSFLGVGVQPPTADWGNMINENRIGLTIQPWGVLLPLAAIAALVVGCNLITDGIARNFAAIETRAKR